MWTTVYITEELDLVEKIENKLQIEGFLVKRKISTNENNDELYEVLVPSSEAQEASNVLLGH